MVDPPSSTPWLPFGSDGEWLQEDRWEANLRLLRDRGGGARALAALRTCFTPAWTNELQGIQPIRHPLITPATNVVGRYWLLQAGLMLAEIKVGRRLRGRLRSVEEFDDTCAELRAGLLLRSSGAEVQFEPVRKGSGPDWLGTWPGGARLAVEVKRPRRSQAVRRSDGSEDEFHSAFFAAMTPPLAVDTGIWVKLHPSDAIAAKKTVSGAADVAAIRALAREAADAIRRNLPNPLREGTFSAGPAGEFTVRFEPRGEVKTHFWMQRATGDAQSEALRLRDTLIDATVQLRSLPEVPGLVLVDAEDDIYLLNQMRDVFEALRTETWASNLAGVALLSQTGTVDEGRAGIRSDGIVWVVPGLRQESLATTLLPRLRVCDRGHHHFDPLHSPMPRCTLEW